MNQHDPTQLSDDRSEHDDHSMEVYQVIRRIPQWRDVKDLEIESLAGLTNSNYKVTLEGESYVLRISGMNTRQLGINRELEIDAQHSASKAGIAPQVIYSLLPEGHLVTRFIHGRHLTLEEYRTPGNIQRIVETVKYLHALPQIEAAFSPFHRVAYYAKQAWAMGVSIPKDFSRMKQKMESIAREQARDTDDWRGFCHNDLFSVNVLDNGTIWFLDWEFAGMGDIYYDLATLCYAYDSADTLTRELQEYLLACYFGEVRDTNWTRLEGMKFMLMFFSAMWGLLQHGMENLGLVESVEEFSYAAYSHTTFEAMRENL